MPKNNTNEKQNVHLATLQTKVDFTCERINDLNEKVDGIIANHLPHIESAISKLDANQKIILAVMFMVIAGLIGLFFKN